jgi:hypothetical protein
MAKVTIGQYAINECDFAIKTGENVYSSIADIEEVSLAIENNVETWQSIANGGWQNALMTGKALTGSFSGKRTLGDTGNDKLDSYRYLNGSEANGDFKITFPDDSTLTFTAVVGLTDILGSATDVAPLNGDLTGKGKPTYTPAA